MPELQDGFGGQCIRIAARWCSVFERFYSLQQPMESDINDVLLWLNLKLDIVGRSGSMLQSEGALHSKHVWTLSNEALQDIYIYIYVCPMSRLHISEAPTPLFAHAWHTNIPARVSEECVCDGAGAAASHFRFIWNPSLHTDIGCDVEQAL